MGARGFLEPYFLGMVMKKGNYILIFILAIFGYISAQNIKGINSKKQEAQGAIAVVKPAAKAVAAPVVKAVSAVAVSGVPVPAKVDVTSKKFTFCSSYPTLGDLDVIGRQLAEGLTMSIASLQKKARKSTITMSYLGNNEKTGSTGLATMKQYLAKTKVILGGVGTTFWQQVFGESWASQAIHLFPISENNHIHNKGYKNTIFYRPTAEQELKVLCEYVIKKQVKDKIAIFYESGFAGNSLFELLVKILTEYGVEPVISARYTAGTVEIDRALTNILQAAPNAIFCLSKPRPTYKFIKYAVDKGQTSILFVGMSPLLSIQNLLKNARGIDLVTTSIVPPETSALQIAERFRAFAGAEFRANRKTSFYLESFLYTELLYWAVEKKPEVVAHPELLVEYFEHIKNVNFYGMPLSFDPATRTLARKLWIVPKADAGASWLEINL